MRVTFIDVEDPVRNVYVDELHAAPTAGGLNDVWDFGLPESNTMHGAWRLLSVERPCCPGSSVPDGRHVRINVIREGRLA